MGLPINNVTVKEILKNEREVLLKRIKQLKKEGSVNYYTYSLFIALSVSQSIITG